MARLSVVKSARKAQGNCEKCGQPINVGDSYCHWSAYRGRKHVYHATAACKPSPDMMTTNEKRAAHMRATDLIDKAKEAEYGGDAAQYLEDAKAEVESIVEQLQDTLDAWSGTNFEYGGQAQSFESTKDALEDWVNQADGWITELQDVDDDILTAGEPEEPDADDYEDGEDDDDYIADRETWDDDQMKYLAQFEALADAQSNIDDLPDLEF